MGESLDKYLLKENEVPGTSNDVSWTQWAADNVFKPAYNAGIVQSYNTFANVVNGAAFGERMTKLEAYKLAPPTSTTDEMVQGISGAAGAILPYALAGKIAGGGMRMGLRNLAMEGATSRFLASEMGANLVGAVAFDALRDTHAGETRLGNVLGGATAFTLFGAGNHATRGLGLSEKLIARAAVGAFGSEAQLGVSKLASGQSVSVQEFRQAALHGAVFNTALPVFQEKILSPAIDAVNVRLGRGIPLERFAQREGLFGKSSTLDNLLGDTLVRVKPEPSAPSSADHTTRTITVNKEGNLAAEVGHEVAHFAIDGEPGFQRAAKMLQEGQFHEAKHEYIKTRTMQETEASRIGKQIEVDTEAKASGKPSRTVDSSEIKLRPEYKEIFEHEWESFHDSNGKFRPQVDHHFDPTRVAQVREYKDFLRRMDAEEQLQPQEKVRYQELRGIMRQHIDAAMTDLRTTQPTFNSRGGIDVPASAPSGPRTQARAWDVMRAVMDTKLTSLGNKTPRQSGLELFAIDACGLRDQVGWDYVLMNKHTGDYIWLDVKEHFDASYSDFHLKNMIVADTHSGIAAQSTRIEQKFYDIMTRFHNEGSPLNVVEIPLLREVPSVSPQVFEGLFHAAAGHRATQLQVMSAWSGRMPGRRAAVQEYVGDIRQLSETLPRGDATLMRRLATHLEGKHLGERAWASRLEAVLAANDPAALTRFLSERRP